MIIYKLAGILLICIAFTNAGRYQCPLIHKRSNRNVSEVINETHNEPEINENDGRTADDEEVDEEMKIYKGQKVRSSIYPFMVSLQEITDEDNFHFCGGAIIDPEWVLTAGHCFDSYNHLVEVDLAVKAGALKWNDDTEDSELITIEKWVLPENYNEHEMYENDIALVHLVRKIKWTDVINSIKLPTASDNFPNKGVIMGWGAYDSEKTTESSRLMQADIQRSNLRKCQKFYKGTLDADKQLCLGAESESNMCSGDSGGPFIQFKGAQPMLVGVASFGTSRCLSYNPSVFTKVTGYLSWIKTTMKAG